MKYCKQLIVRFPVLYTVFYFPFYLIWFQWLQKRSVPHEWICSRLDQFIPFCAWFVIPYLLWFAFVAATIFFFLCTSREDYFRLCTALYGGMTLCLLIYTLLPNGQLLRPRVMPDNSLLTQLVFFIYRLDPSINSCPSIHVLNSMVCQNALMHCEALRGKWKVKTASALLTILICMATVFLKQHSILDLLAAAGIFVVLDMLVYREVRVTENHKPKLQANS